MNAKKLIEEAQRIISEYDERMRKEAVQRQTDVAIELICHAFTDAMSAPLEKKLTYNSPGGTYGECDMQAVLTNESVREIIEALIAADFRVHFSYNATWCVTVNVRNKTFFIGHGNSGYEWTNTYEDILSCFESTE